MQRDTLHIASLSYLRIASTLAVILMHVCSVLVNNPELFPLTEREALFFDCVIGGMTWAVPCFLMISGALLLKRDRQITVRACLCRYVPRLLWALLIFGVPFGLLMEYSEAGTIYPAHFVNALGRVLANRSFAHLWYVYVMIGIYLLLPGIKLFTDHADRATLKYVLIALFVINFIVPFVSQVTGLEIAFELPAPSCFLFYLLLGHYIHHYRPKWSLGILVPGLGVMLFTALVIVGNIRDRGAMSALLVYENPLVAVASVCVFSLFQGVRRPVTQRSWALDRLSFGVYLIHPVFIHLVYRVLGVTPTGKLFILKTLAMTCFTALLSYFSSWVLKKLPFLGKRVL